MTLSREDIVHLGDEELKDLLNEKFELAMDLKIQYQEAEYKKSCGLEVDEDWFHRLTMAKNFANRDKMTIDSELRRRKIENEKIKEKTFMDIAREMLDPEVFAELLDKFKSQLPV